MLQNEIEPTPPARHPCNILRRLPPVPRIEPGLFRFREIADVRAARFDAVISYLRRSRVRRRQQRVDGRRERRRVNEVKVLHVVDGAAVTHERDERLAAEGLRPSPRPVASAGKHDVLHFRRTC